MRPASFWDSQTTAQLTLTNNPAALVQLSEWQQAVARANELTARCAFHLELVVVEAVTNIIQHAYPPDAAGEIVVLIRCEPERVLVEVNDTGRPFDPTTMPEHHQPGSLAEAPIGGLGLHLIRSYTQQLEYQRVGRWNQLRMTITRDA